MRIVFTGGGSAGHVTPNIALIEKCLSDGWQVFYIGSKTGLERSLISKLNLPYFSISSGKLRRYFSWQNFIDPFKILLGTVQAFYYCLKIRPNVVFAKGGFVSVPVVIAASTLRIPVVVHESDLTPGLANRISFPFARKICLTFDETKKFVDSKKAVVTGTPIRSALFNGDQKRGLLIGDFSQQKKIILVLGGGQGAGNINRVVREALPKLLQEYVVLHVCGKGKVDNSIELADYVQFEYLHDELSDALAAAYIVISRAGANAIFELLALKKPHILIPLAKNASRGDQILNANYFAALGYSQVVSEEELNVDTLCDKILWVANHQDEIKASLEGYKKLPSVQIIYDILAQQNS